jgi:addiction module HigA family antidote
MEGTMLKREMPPEHPGIVLKEMYLEPLGVSVTEFADNIGVARRTVSLIINGHSGISAEMALRLSKAFKTSPELWLGMQQKYDLWNAGKKVTLTGIKYLAARAGTVAAHRTKAGSEGLKNITVSKSTGVAISKSASSKRAIPAKKLYLKKPR